MGPVGAGQTTKMVNQVLVLNNYCVLAEALALAEAGGVDAAKIPAGARRRLRRQHHAAEALSAPRGARLRARRLRLPGAEGPRHAPDLAKALQVPTPMSAQAASLFRILNAKGHGQLDGLAVLKLYDAKERL